VIKKGPLALVGEVTLNSSDFRLGGSLWSGITYTDEPTVGNLAANRELRDEVNATIPAAVVVGRGGWQWLHNAGGATGRRRRSEEEQEQEETRRALVPVFG
jgi:hypothetical protein